LKPNLRKTIFWLSIGLNIILISTILGLGVLVWCFSRYDRDHSSSRTNYHPPHLEFPEGKSSITIPLEQDGDQLFARAKVNGAEAGYFQIDTGTDKTKLTHEISSRLKLKEFLINIPGFGKCKIMPGTSGLYTNSYANVWLVKSVALEGVNLSASALSSAETHHVVDGTNILGGFIGCDVLSEYPFTLDYLKPSLTIYKQNEFVEPPIAYRVPLELNHNLPCVKATIDGNHHALLIIDTGAMVSLWLDRPFVEKHYPDVLSRKNPRTVFGIGGEGKIQSDRINTLSFDNIRRQGVWTEFSVTPAPQGVVGAIGVDGILGGGFLQNYRVTFDLAHKALWLEEQAVESVEELRARGRRLDARDLAGNTPLMTAARLGQTMRVKAFIEAGADVKAKNKIAITALVNAVLAGDVEIVKLLVQAGAEVNAANAEGSTPLIFAAVYEMPDIVRALIEEGANIDARTSEGFTPLIHASGVGDLATVKILLEAGADVNRSSNLGVTALMIAANNGRTEIVRILIEAGADLDAKDVNGDAALRHAEEKQRVEIVELLKKAGAK